MEIRSLASLDRPGDTADPPIAQLRSRLGLDHIIGESPTFVALLKQIASVAKHDVCVLILGETGTGKEVFARAIHYCSERTSKPFIPVNCGAVPVDLLENEFFGHESGAFTSANCPRRGIIKEADGGTLFLDEVDCLPPFAQVKLLRFLQDGQFRPLGSASTCSADVRVVAASNANFKEILESGRLRKDLYYRLNVLSMQLPPLREREGDIALLARHFLAQYASKFKVEARDFSAAALQKLIYYPWPGNVREFHFIGLLLTVIAVSPGAPFWFEVLSKIISVRASGDPQSPTRKMAPTRKCRVEAMYLLVLGLSSVRTFYLLSALMVEESFNLRTCLKA
jgi:transcriptional regulator with PAS, ATPase and Fis domain